MRVDLAHDAVFAGLFRVFLDIAAEQLVPDDQHPGVVTVDVLGVAGVMHAMVRWRVEHVFQPAQFADSLGVDKKLECEIDCHHRDDMGWCKTNPRQRQPE